MAQENETVNCDLGVVEENKNKNTNKNKKQKMMFADVSHKGNVGAKERCSQFPRDTYEDGGKLFCIACNKVIDHVRKSTVESHLLSAAHAKRKSELDNEKKTKKQKTVPTMFAANTIAQQERADVTLDWVKACTATNIPLSKSDNPELRKFLRTRVKNGGAIPGTHQLQNIYLTELYKQEVIRVKAELSNKPICVIFDEMSDDEGRYVLNILACPVTAPKDENGLLKSYLLDVCFLEKTNHSTVAQAVVGVLNEYGITFDNVAVFDTDNAAYMKKAYKEILKGLYPKAIHCTCLAHITNLVGESFRKPLADLDKFVRCFSQQFFNAGGRKKRYLDYLKLKEQPPLMPPDPVGTRWNSWFFAVQYHAKYWPFYQEYIADEMKVCGKNAPNSVIQLHEFTTGELWNRLDLTVRFVADVCTQIIYYLGYFESQKPCTLYAFEKLEELQIFFDSHSLYTHESARKYFDSAPCADDMPLKAKQELVALFNACTSAASEKLMKYLSDNDGQPALPFLKQCRIFNPLRVPVLSENINDYPDIPDFDTVPRNEFILYREVLVSEVQESLRGTGQTKMDIDSFWISNRDRIPTMAALAFKYKDAVTNSADAERSNSLYNNVLTDKRRSLSVQKLRELVFMYYNSHAWKHTEPDYVSEIE